MLLEKYPEAAAEYYCSINVCLPSSTERGMYRNKYALECAGGGGGGGMGTHWGGFCNLAK